MLQCWAHTTISVFFHSFLLIGFGGFLPVWEVIFYQYIPLILSIPWGIKSMSALTIFWFFSSIPTSLGDFFNQYIALIRNLRLDAKSMSKSTIFRFFSEVLAMLGHFLLIDLLGIFRYFHQGFGDFFPLILEVKLFLIWIFSATFHHVLCQP